MLAANLHLPGVADPTHREVFFMDDKDPTRQTEHEERVAEIEHERSGEPSGQADPTQYEREIEEERTGASADQVEEEVREDERTPLDAGYTGGRTG
jgi:hypothetical protein